MEKHPALYMNLKVNGDKKLFPVTPEMAKAILMNDYIGHIHAIKRYYDIFNVETPGYADEMRAGTWVLEDPDNWIPVRTNIGLYRVSNRRLWGIVQSGKTITLPMYCEYWNFEEVYKQNLSELPKFLNDFFGTNLVDVK